MPGNVLVTGPPGSGKTTAIERAVDGLREHGVSVGGVVAPERRVDGERVGFDVCDLETERAKPMARVDFEAGPVVGRYRVDVESVDAVAGQAIRGAVGRVDVLVIDEIAPMQATSDVFRDATAVALDASTPLVAAIKQSGGSAFVDDVRSRTDVETFLVTPATRDALPRLLLERVQARLTDT